MTLVIILKSKIFENNSIFYIEIYEFYGMIELPSYFIALSEFATILHIKNFQ